MSQQNLAFGLCF